MSTTNERLFRPFRKVVLPVFFDTDIPASLAAAASLGVEIRLVGLLVVPPGTSPSEKTEQARKLRAHLQTIAEREGLKTPPELVVSPQPWRDLWKLIAREKGNLVLLEYPTHFTGPWGIKEEYITVVPCDLAILRGDWPSNLPHILVPVRGGPSAELALRLGMSIPKSDLEVIHFSSGKNHHSDEPFKGLEKILPTLPDVIFHRDESENAAESIKNFAVNKDILILGASAKGVLPLTRPPVYSCTRPALPSWFAVRGFPRKNGAGQKAPCPAPGRSACWLTAGLPKTPITPLNLTIWRGWLKRRKNKI
jgi:glucosyl-3-phosphoglycerate synthase